MSNNPCKVCDGKRVVRRPNNAYRVCPGCGGEGIMSEVVALPAATYLIHTMDSGDGETELENVETGQTWDPNADYGRYGEWTRNALPVAYGDLQPGDVATLLETVYLTLADAETMGG
jgi:hypothetical protein